MITKMIATPRPAAVLAASQAAWVVQTVPKQHGRLPLQSELLEQVVAAAASQVA